LTIPTLIISLIFFGAFPVELNISIASFSLFIVLISLIGSSIAILIFNLFKNKNSVEFVSSMIILITSIWGGGIVNVEDSNKIIGFIRDCLPQKRLIDLANSYNNADLIFLIIMIVVFISISLIIGERKYRNGEFI
jgi:ABC-type multidrug transport system permease subunit